MARYYVSKLLELLLVRELADQMSKSNKGNTVIVSILNPGSVITDIARDEGFRSKVFAWLLHHLLARPTEEGARTLVHAAEGGEETHGQYLDDCEISQYVMALETCGSMLTLLPHRPSSFVTSAEGLHTQKKMWNELTEKLERIHPGIISTI